MPKVEYQGLGAQGKYQYYPQYQLYQSLLSTQSGEPFAVCGSVPAAYLRSRAYRRLGAGFDCWRATRQGDSDIFIFTFIKP